MKCINKYFIVLITLIFSAHLFGCGRKLEAAYDINSNVSAFRFDDDSNEKKLNSYAEDICVVNENVNEKKINMTAATSACLFDITNKETKYSKNANELLHPASTTKVMTALLAFKYGNLDDIVTASANVNIKESGAVMCGFKQGDRASLEEVLYGLLLTSGNDAAVMIAEHIAGSESAFVDMMNEEARNIGATHTNFANPHGLTDESHKTTAYDLYLIFNEALKYEKFKSIISAKEHELKYTNAEGNQKTFKSVSTNKYFSGGKSSPENVKVLGGKTGTTEAAKSCLILYSQKENQDSYVSVVLHSEDADSLYENMNSLMGLE